MFLEFTAEDALLRKAQKFSSGHATVCASLGVAVGAAEMVEEDFRLRRAVCVPVLWAPGEGGCGRLGGSKQVCQYLLSVK